MLGVFVQRQKIAKARKLFDEMPEMDVVLRNLMLSAGADPLRALNFLYLQSSLHNFLVHNFQF